MKKKNVKFINDLLSGKFANMVSENLVGEKISNSQELFNIMKPLTETHKDVECFYGIFLNSQNQIIKIEKLFSGSIISASVYPREVIKKAIELQASAIIFCHNHPSGNSKPSKEDILITKRLFVAMEAIGITIHEHVIIGNDFYSMADYGVVSEIKKEVNSFLASFNN